MKKIYLTILIILFSINITLSQNKWTSSIQISFISQNNKSYFYNDNNKRIYDTNLDVKGFPINSFSFQGDYSYFVFNKLSVGILSGYQFQSKPNFSMIKLGAIIKYFFNKDEVFIYLQDANNFTLNKFKFKSGNNIRFGIGIPIFKIDNLVFNTNIYLEQNYFKLDKCQPILGVENEIPRSLTVKSFGISPGVKL